MHLHLTYGNSISAVYSTHNIVFVFYVFPRVQVTQIAMNKALLSVGSVTV